MSMQMPSRMLVACPQCGKAHQTSVSHPRPVHGDDPCPLVVAMHEKQLELLAEQIKAVRAPGYASAPLDPPNS